MAFELVFLFCLVFPTEKKTNIGPKGEKKEHILFCRKAEVRKLFIVCSWWYLVFALGFLHLQGAPKRCLQEIPQFEIS